MLVWFLSGFLFQVKGENSNFRFLFAEESFENIDHTFKSNNYHLYTFEISQHKKLFKQYYIARLKNAVVSFYFVGVNQVVSSYYKTGELGFSDRRPPIQEILARFLERTTVRFSLEKESLVIENADSLQLAFMAEVNAIYPESNEFPPGQYSKDFKIRDLLPAFSSAFFTFPEDIQNAGDMSLKNGVVVNYKEDVGNLQHVEITDTRKHKSYELFIPKGSNVVKYRKTGGYGGGTIYRTFGLGEKFTIQLHGTFANQKNKTIEFEVESLSRIDPTKRISAKTNASGDFILLLGENSPVFISASSGHHFFAEPGDVIFVKSGSKDDSLTFKGIGADNNAFLEKECQMENFPNENYWEGNLGKQADWFRKIDRISNQRFAILKNFSPGLSPVFYESKFLNYYFGAVNRKLDLAFGWIDYNKKGWLKRTYPGLDTIPSRYQSFVFNRELNRYLENIFIVEFEKLRNFTYVTGNGYLKTRLDPTQKEMLQLASLTYSGKILSDYFEFVAPRIYSSKNSGDEKLLQDYVQEYFDNSALQTKISRLFEKTIVLDNGTEFPLLKFRSIEGETLDWSKFNGKVVYLMFWRNDALVFDKTWIDYCNLIAGQSPENVLFVNVGVEEDFTKWKTYVETMKLKGLNLFIDRNSDEFKLYFSQLKSRHFFLVDATGKIINNNGPDPSVASVLIAQNTKSTSQEKNMFAGLVILVGVLAVVSIGWILDRIRKKRKARIEILLAKLRETELKAIKAQMNPHFLFNSLNSIQNLINQNEIQPANQYLSKFARLLRSVLQYSEKELIPLSDELETTNLYIQLEKLRFNFEYELQLDPQIDVYNTYVPPLLIQPFIENAILHGLQPKQNDRRLKICIEENDDRLFFKIIDNGVGYNNGSDTSNNHSGIGNKLSSERIDLLNQKNKGNFRLSIGKNPDDSDGTCVNLSFVNNLM